MKETMAALQVLAEIDREIDKRNRARAALVDELEAQAAGIDEAERGVEARRGALATLEERGAPADERDAARQAIRSTEQDAARLREAHASGERAVRLMTNAFQRELSQLALRRIEARDRVPTNIVKRYEALLSGGRRPAVATVTKGCCSGCHMALPTRFEQALATEDGLQSCPHCRRILCGVDRPRASRRA